MSTSQPASASPLPEGVTDPNYKPLPGRLGNLTIPQQHALEKLKAEVTQEGWFVAERMDDATLLRYARGSYLLRPPLTPPLSRFLRARKFDVALSKKMLQEFEQWRKDFGVEEIFKYVVRPRNSNKLFTIAPGTLTLKRGNKSTNTILRTTTRPTRYVRCLLVSVAAD